jgi:hypothetical protein
MDRHSITLGLMMGLLLFAIGLVPGLAHSLMQRFAEGLRNFRDGYPHPRIDDESKSQSGWTAAAGAALIVLSVCAYLSK